MTLSAYAAHPELPKMLAIAVTIPAGRLDRASVLRLGNMMYCLWQYVATLRTADVAQPVEEQRELAAVGGWFRDTSVLYRRYYPSASGTLSLSLTQDAETQMNKILSRDPTVTFDFDITNACIRMMAGVSLA